MAECDRPGMDEIGVSGHDPDEPARARIPQPWRGIAEIPVDRDHPRSRRAREEPQIELAVSGQRYGRLSRSPVPEHDDFLIAGRRGDPSTVPDDPQAGDRVLMAAE